MRILIDTQLQMIEVDGVKISLAALLQLVRPDPNTVYRFERKGDMVIAHAFQVKEGQSGN